MTEETEPADLGTLDLPLIDEDPLTSYLMLGRSDQEETDAADQALITEKFVAPPEELNCLDLLTSIAAVIAVVGVDVAVVIDAVEELDDQILVAFDLTKLLEVADLIRYVGQIQT